VLYRKRPGEQFRGRGKKFPPGRFRYSRLKEASRQMLRVRTVESLKEAVRFGPLVLWALNAAEPYGMGVSIS
jgi:hypothetical protein